MKKRNLRATANAEILAVGALHRLLLLRRFRDHLDPLGGKSAQIEAEVHVEVDKQIEKFPLIRVAADKQRLGGAIVLKRNDNKINFANAYP